MTESAAPYSDGSDIYTDGSRDLRVVEDSASPRELGSERYRYPDYTFPLTKEQIVERSPGGIFEPVIVTDKERAAAVLSALEQTCGDEYEGFSGITTRDKRLTRASSYLGQMVTTVDGKKRRKEVVDQDAAREQLRQELAEENNPVEQELQQVESDFGGALSDEQLAKLANDVLIVTHWKRLHAVYASQVDEQRHPRGR
jgi:hypothetical protein